MKKIVFFAAALALLAMSSAAQATLLLPGTTVVADGFPELGTLVTQTGVIPYAPTVGTHPTGTVNEAVYRETGGTLDFVYQFNVSHGPLEHLTAGSYTGWTTDVSESALTPAFFASVAGAPNSTTINVNRTGDGSTVSFNYNPALGAGAVSEYLIVRTNATQYSDGTIGFIDGAGAGVYGFAPGPEPTSLVLFGGLAVGLCGAGLRRRRQQAKAVTA